MKRYVQLKSVLLGGASLMAVGVFALPAVAADQQVETITVTGIRAAMQSAQNIKQNSDQVVDSITAVDIGALPDRDVADALQRIPGVTLVRTDQTRDPVRYGGTGSSVSIRGLAWSQSLTNGRDVFSSANGRGLSFGDVSADLLTGVDVYKNPNAKQIEGGVGGTVDLRTRKPFDQDGQLIAVGGDYTWSMLNKRLSPSVNGLYSNRWSTPIGEIGLLVSADWQDQRNRVNAVSKSEYYCVDFTGANATGSAACDSEDLKNSSGVNQKGYVPGALGPRQVDWQQQRFATDIVLQWRPSEKTEITIEALNASANLNDLEHTMLFYPDKGNDTAACSTVTSGACGYKFDAQGTWTGGEFKNAWTQYDTRVGKHHDRTTDLSANAKYTPTDNLTFTADAQFVESMATNYSMTGFTNNSVPDISFDYSGSSPTFNLIKPNDTTVTNTGIDAVMDHMEYNVAHAFSYRADAQWTNGDKSSWLKGISAGFRGENKLSILRQTGYGWEGSGMWWGYMPGEEKVLNTFNFGGLLGNTGLSAVMWNPNVLNKDSQYVVKTIAAAIPATSPTTYATNAGCTGPDVYCLKMYSALNPAADDQDAGINPVKENILSGYVMADFGHDSFLGFDVPIDGNIGVRIVNTQDNIAAGKLAIPAITQTCAIGPQTVNGVSFTVPTGGCNDLLGAIAYAGTAAGASYVLPAVSNSYTDVTPSFNIRAHLSDTLQVRAAYSQAIVRPSFDTMYNFASVGFNFYNQGSAQEGTLKAGSLGQTGTAGNPYLKPMHAQQYDASVEWYFAPTGSLSFALFHKDLSNYFYAATQARAITNPASGKTSTFYVTTTMNGGEGKVEGFEFAYQQFFDSLPGAWSGLGTQFNYTKIYNSGGQNQTVNVFDSNQVKNPNQHVLPLEGMSPDSANIALLYAKYGIDARLAYNWRSGFLLTSSAANSNQPEWQRNYGQLDGSVFYSFLEHYKVGLQMTNLLNTTTKIDVGYKDSGIGIRPYDWLNIDQKVSLILRANW
ncbi:MAG: TonB-dependent receptor [Rhizomicrobium sp.]|nr:TonB-dependent receptor [Rhizomicrobium sp.]